MLTFSLQHRVGALHGISPSSSEESRPRARVFSSLETVMDYVRFYTVFHADSMIPVVTALEGEGFSVLYDSSVLDTAGRPVHMVDAFYVSVL